MLGIDLSEVYIVDNNLGDVTTESFGGCEYFNKGSASFYRNGTTTAAVGMMMSRIWSACS